MYFDESKHPRTEDGRFTVANGTGKSFRQNTSYSEILAEDRKKNKIDLSKQEWAMLYERIGKIKKEGHYVCTTKNGDMLIPIETNKSNVLVIASGSYQNPKVKYAVRFYNKDYMYRMIERLEEV